MMRSILVGMILALIPHLTQAADAPTSPRELFTTTRAHTLELRLTPEHWNLLTPGAGASFVRSAKAPQTKSKSPPQHQPDPDHDVALRQGPSGNAFAYVRCDMIFDGQTVANIGLRFKGHFSYSVSASTLRRPFKLDFERFVDGQRFAGLSMLNLNNQAVDPSQAREVLAYELYRELGVPASRTGYALVYLTVSGLYDHEYLGLYTLIEEVDNKFLKRHFKNDDGLFLKPQGMRGLAYFGEDWSAYVSRYLPRKKVDDKYARRIIDLARTINRADDATFARLIASYFDVDELLRYVAVGGALTNFDSFLSTGHNYGLYINPTDLRVSIIPWDVNMTFGGYSWVGTDAQIENVAIVHPFVDDNYIVERILAIPAYREAYRGHVRQLVEGGMAPERFRKRLQELQPIFKQAADAAKKAGKAGNPTTRTATYPGLRQPDLMSYVENRARSMRLQLEGKEPGYVPAFLDPNVVPHEWARLVVPAHALLAAMDADGNGRIDDREAADAFRELLQAGGAQPNGAIDLAAATKAIERLSTPELRHAAAPQAWAKWLFRVADVNHDGKIDAAELTAAYQRHLRGADADFDNQMGGREMIEAMSGTGPP